MEQYKDEMISKAKKMLKIIEETSKIDAEIEKEIEISISNPYCPIFGIHVQFEDVLLLDNKIKIKVPKTFFSRSEEDIKAVYFLGQPPKLVLSDGILPFMVTFNPTETKILNHEIAEFGKIAKNIVNRIGSKSKILGEQFFKKDEGNIFVLETLVQTLDGVSYNLLFFSSVEEYLWLGSVVFDSKYSKRLIPIAKEIVSTFEVLINKEA